MNADDPGKFQLMQGESKKLTKNWLMVNYPETSKKLEEMSFDDIYVGARYQIEANFRYIRMAHDKVYEYRKAELEEFFYRAN